MTWSLAGDNKHGTIAILTVLCVGLYLYQFEDINSGLHKIEANESSSYNQINLVKANQDRVTTKTRAKIGSKHYGNRMNLSRKIEIEEFVKHKSLNKKQFSFHKNNISGPNLTIFTFLSKSNEADFLRINTVRNWRRFSPCLYPILFTNDTGLIKDLGAMGWDSLPILHARKGVPVLKQMYLDAMEKVQSPLYAFVNGDILFKQSPLDTLESILQSALYQITTTLLVGRRKNVFNVKRDLSFDFKVLVNEAVKNRTFLTFSGLDYLITSKTFPWRDMPDVVFGRNCFDSLILESKKRKIGVIDSTKTFWRSIKPLGSRHIQTKTKISI